MPGKRIIMNKADPKIVRFVNGLNSIGIRIILQANFPWVYIISINGNLIPKEEFTANHGYNLGYVTAQRGGDFKFENLPRTVKLIRKYRNK